ncbi:MAG: ABC transporter permease [Rhizobiales bacterium]|nr:ABC transporter permease [Hyphomicrobiales bacterium]
MKTRDILLFAGSLAVVAAILFLWWLAAVTGTVSRAFVPNPFDAWAALIDGFRRGDLLSQTMGTVGRMLQGWLLAGLIGVVLGAAIGLSRTARDYLQPTLEFLRPLPASAIIPVAIALMGLSPAMALTVVAFGSLWPTLLGTIHGFAEVEPRLKEVARCLQMSGPAFAWKMGLPNAMPDILAGMRLSMTVALILAIICEMLASQAGLGTAILLAARSFQSADLFAGIALLGAIGLVSNLALRAVEKHTLRWQTQH